MSKVAVARLAIAAIALSLILLPGEVWSGPASDFEQEGFDPDLVYVQESNRYLFDPFLVLENGTWEACPCAPGSELTISGENLGDSVSQNAEGAKELGGLQVLVGWRLATLHLLEFPS